MKLLNKERIFLEDLEVLIERNDGTIYLDMVANHYKVSEGMAINIIKEHIDKPFWISGYNGGGRIAKLISFNFGERYNGSLHNEDAEVFIPEPYRQYDFTYRYDKDEHQSEIEKWKNKQVNTVKQVEVKPPLTFWQKVKQFFA